MLRPSEISAVNTEHLPPDNRRTVQAFSRLGYSLADSLSDLVDNCIDAKASDVLIQLVRSDEKILRVVVADNGHGMDDPTLSEAMRFGTRNEKGQAELGKYGIGLKTASFAHAATVTVLSRAKAAAIGRRWLQSNIEQGWNCEILAPRDVSRFLEGTTLGPLGKLSKGTVVIWEDLQHLRTTTKTIEKALHRAVSEIRTALGLRFHRFIAEERLAIHLDVVMSTDDGAGNASAVLALDPFAYPVSGKDGYPKEFRIDAGSPLTLECHIWPPKSGEAGYKLGGGKVSARQGFYFYRNDRLIQAGGWNGCREDDTEPHLSLARVRIDLPPTLDAAFSLDVKKTHVEPPPDFSSLVNAASSSSGRFKDFVSDAQSAYRKNKKIEKALFKYVPGAGFPAAARKAVRAELRERGAPPDDVGFRWVELGSEEFVRIDRDEGNLLLNKSFRSKALQGSNASATDLPLVKLLLLLLFQSEFDRRVSAPSREREARINRALIQTLKKAL